MKCLTPKQVTKSQVSRLAVVEVINGAEIKVIAKRSSIVSDNGSGDISINLEVSSDPEGYEELIANADGFLDANVKPFMLANEEIETLTIAGKLLKPGGEYLIPQPAMVAESVNISRKGEPTDGGPKSFYVPPSLLSEYANRIGFITSNMFPMPASLAVSLISSDDRTARSIRQRIRSLPSLWGKHTHKPEYIAVLSTYETEEEALLSWRI